MDYTQTFEEFSKGLTTTDLALYAGIALVAWVFLKDKLNPVSELVKKLFDSFKNKTAVSVVPKNPVPSLSDLTLVAPVVNEATTKVAGNDNEIFFLLINSWKQTRDLAVKSGCSQAVKVADQMFPYLSPTVCNKEKEITNE